MSIVAEFLLTVMYTQITVAVPGAAAGGLAWSDDHVAQGFAWSPGFVSFGVPDHDGDVRVIVRQVSGFDPSPETLWAVQVPIEVGVSPIFVGTILDERAVSIAPGSYNLVFEAQRPDPAEAELVAYVLRLHFVEASRPGFAIVTQGDVLETDRVLRETADPA